MQRDLRAAKDVASSSAAHAAGVQANEQELQQLQVLSHCLMLNSAFVLVGHWFDAKGAPDTHSRRTCM